MKYWIIVLLLCGCDGAGPDVDRQCVTEPGLRDPRTGQCGDGDSDDADADDEETLGYDEVCSELSSPPHVNWGSCVGECAALSTEADCDGNAACRSIFVDLGQCPTGSALPLRPFAGCWQAPPELNDLPTPCEGLEAQGCSERADCVAVHADDWYCPEGAPCAYDPCFVHGIGAFLRCEAALAM